MKILNMTTTILAVILGLSIGISVSSLFVGRDYYLQPHLINRIELWPETTLNQRAFGDQFDALALHKYESISSTSAKIEYETPYGDEVGYIRIHTKISVDKLVLGTLGFIISITGLFIIGTIRYKRQSNHRIEPFGKSPGDEVDAQGSQAHL